MSRGDTDGESAADAVAVNARLMPQLITVPREMAESCGESLRL